CGKDSLLNTRPSNSWVISGQRLGGSSDEFPGLAGLGWGTMLQVTPVRAFTDNYIWLIHAPRAPRRVVVVDPGDAAPVQRALAAGGLELAGILLTHHHADHVGGVADLLRMNSGPVKIFGPATESVPGNPVRLREGDTV